MSTEWTGTGVAIVLVRDDDVGSECVLYGGNGFVVEDDGVGSACRRRIGVVSARRVVV